MILNMETKELNLCEILKDWPRGSKLYSLILGDVELNKILHSDKIILVRKGIGLFKYRSDGKIDTDDFEFPVSAEIMLYPSRDNRDWSTCQQKKEHFDPKTLKPFDKVLVRDTDSSPWQIDLFGYIYPERYICTSGCSWKRCIPFNDDTKHLVGKTDEAPEYYRYWE